jgi:hypothetical protein
MTFIFYCLINPKIRRDWANFGGRLRGAGLEYNV